MTVFYWLGGPVKHEFKIDISGYGDLLVILHAQSVTRGPIRVALLIEDKISAGAQPRQAERYREFGKKWLGVHWTEFKTVLVAPEKYVGEKQEYDCFVSLEDVCGWICPEDPERAAFRKKKLLDAIAKKSMTGIQIVDQPLTDFRKSYFDYVSEFNAQHKTDFECEKPRPAYDGSSWLHLGSSHFISKCRIRHKLWTSYKEKTGKIELGFLDTDFSRSGDLKRFIESDMKLFPNERDMKLFPNGKHKQHTSIEIDVPEIRNPETFASAKDRVEKALKAGERLWRMYVANKNDIDVIVVSARQKQGSK